MADGDLRTSRNMTEEQARRELAAAHAQARVLLRCARSEETHEIRRALLARVQIWRKRARRYRWELRGLRRRAAKGGAA